MLRIGVVEIPWERAHEEVIRVTEVFKTGFQQEGVIELVRDVLCNAVSGSAHLLSWSRAIITAITASRCENVIGYAPLALRNAARAWIPTRFHHQADVGDEGQTIGRFPRRRQVVPRADGAVDVTGALSRNTESAHV